MSPLQQAAKGLAAAPQDKQRDHQLSLASKGVKEDIKELLKSVDAAIPGKKDLMAAQQKILAATNRLTQPSIGRGNPQVPLFAYFFPPFLRF